MSEQTWTLWIDTRHGLRVGQVLQIYGMLKLSETDDQNTHRTHARLLCCRASFPTSTWMKSFKLYRNGKSLIKKKAHKFIYRKPLSNIFTFNNNIVFFFPPSNSQTFKRKWRFFSLDNGEILKTKRKIWRDHDMRWDERKTQNDAVRWVLLCSFSQPQGWGLIEVNRQATSYKP